MSGPYLYSLEQIMPSRQVKPHLRHVYAIYRPTIENHQPERGKTMACNVCRSGPKMCPPGVGCNINGFTVYSGATMLPAALRRLGNPARFAVAVFDPVRRPNQPMQIIQPDVDASVSEQIEREEELGATIPGAAIAGRVQLQNDLRKLAAIEQDASMNIGISPKTGPKTSPQHAAWMADNYTKHYSPGGATPTPGTPEWEAYMADVTRTGSGSSSGQTSGQASGSTASQTNSWASAAEAAGRFIASLQNPQGQQQNQNQQNQNQQNQQANEATDRQLDQLQRQNELLLEHALSKSAGEGTATPAPPSNTGTYVLAAVAVAGIGAAVYFMSQQGKRAKKA